MFTMKQTTVTKAKQEATDSVRAVAADCLAHGVDSLITWGLVAIVHTVE